MSKIEAFENRKQLAASRAEQIRLGLQSAGVLYAAAVKEEDWKVLGCNSVQDWNRKEFGPDRFSPDNRKRLVGMYSAWGWTTRQIEAATGASHGTVVKDRAEARGQDRPQEHPESNIIELSARQQAAYEREAQRARQREVERLAAEARELESQRRRVAEMAGLAVRLRAEEEQRRQRPTPPAPPAPLSPPLPPPPAPTPLPPLVKPVEPVEPVEPEASVPITSERLLEEHAKFDVEVRRLRDRGKTQREIADQLSTTFNRVQDAWQRLEGEDRGRALGGLNGRPRNWNGKSNDKRLRELRAERDGSHYLELLDAQYKFAQMCQVLESIHIQDYGLGDVELWKISDVYEDLVSLGEWYFRQLSAVQGYLGRFPRRQTIEKLRNTGGRTPEERASALRLADKLERSLENGLA
jgi:hypothetical protein